MAAQVGDMIVERGGKLVAVGMAAKREKLSGYLITGIAEAEVTTSWREPVTRDVEVTQPDDSKKREKRTVYEQRSATAKNPARWLQSAHGEFDELPSGEIVRREQKLSVVGRKPADILSGDTLDIPAMTATAQATANVLAWKEKGNAEGVPAPPPEV